MDRLCDEVIQLILNELDDPTCFSLVSKRYYTFTQDSYVRTWYFISRYGKIQAFYWALGRGRLMNEQVIDTLLSSGAHLSRYFVQCAMHHYYRTAQVPFIKTPWVRSMDLAVFTHFQAAAVKRFGNIPLGKGDDDGSLVDAVIKESRFPIEQRQIKWETLKEVLEKYMFIPFCHKDAMMANFPLALAIEPRLLPYARANGFTMDHKYRNFVFRKMFEKPAISFEGRADEIVRNVQELSRLDPRMFLSRTVAAEICMEVKSNEQAYNALKRLDKEGYLRFELATVVESLIKTFVKTRSISTPATFFILKQLFQDFPSNDPTVRLVLLLQVFTSVMPLVGMPDSDQSNHRAVAEKCREKIESMGLPPVEKADLIEVLSNEFAPERYTPVIHYARHILGMSSKATDDLLQQVAFRCLEVGCKAKMLEMLVKTNSSLHDVIRARVMRKYRLNVDDLPPWEDERACNLYDAPLSQDFRVKVKMEVHKLTELIGGPGNHAPALAPTRQPVQSRTDEMEDDDEVVDGALHKPVKDQGRSQQVEDDLGQIGQDSLSTMIRKDESAPARGRRRYHDPFSLHESENKLPYPSSAERADMCKWVSTRYGVRSGVAAIFMQHAAINGTPTMMQLPSSYPNPWVQENRVPITLKLFKLLARLGRQPHYHLFDEIEQGAEFYFSEEDYLSPEELSGTVPKKKRRHSRIKVKLVTEYSVKAESSPPSQVVPRLEPPPSSSVSAPSTPQKRRPRRSAVSSNISYVVPDSDDEMIADEDDDVMRQVKVIARKRKVESNLQKWIKNLDILLKEEQRKYKERKKFIHATTLPGSKLRVPKNEFYKALAASLARLRKLDKEKRHQLYGADIPDDDYSSGDEDEYQERTTRSAKRRKIEIV